MTIMPAIMIGSALLSGLPSIDGCPETVGGIAPRWFQCASGPIVDGVPVIYCAPARLDPQCPDFEPDIMTEEPRQ